MQARAPAPASRGSPPSPARAQPRAARQRPRVRLLVRAVHKAWAAPGTSKQLLTAPEEVVLQCLSVARRGDLAELEPYLPPGTLAPPGTPVLVAGVPVREAGPLARASPLLDSAARRVLPGHLLRRCRVLSAVSLGGSALLRTAVTACTGEEAVLCWRLGLQALPGMQALPQQPQPARQQAPLEPGQQRQPTQQGGSSSRGSRGGGGSGGAPPPAATWQVLSCERDSSADGEEPLPRRPQPRLSPEAAVLAQVCWLQRGDPVAAAAFNMLGRHPSGAGYDAHLAAWRALLAQPAYAPLLQPGRGALLASSALPSQRQFLQEVRLAAGSGSSSGSSGAQRGYLWRLGQGDAGVWAVRSIEAL